jgi:5-keto 4-deoxyuronate isomerase
LTITPATTTGSVTTSINAGESYTWPANGQTYTTAQNGTTFVSGCNTATLNLTVITTQIPASPYAVCTGATVATATAGTTLKFYKDTKSTTAAYAGTQKLAAATYYVTEMVSGTESARVPVSVTLTALVAPTTIASTEAKVICKYMGTSNLVTFTTTPVAGASSYSWSVPAGATIEGNATGESITVSFEAVSGTPGLIGSVTVDSKNSLGCLSGKAKILALTTKAPTAPKTVVLTNGATVIKKAGNFVGDATKELTLTATDISGTADHHVWTLPAGTTVVTGDANNDLVLTVHLGNVTASNDALVFSCASVGGCGSSSKSLSIARAAAGTPKAITLTDALSATPTVGIKKLDAYTGSLKTRTLTLTATPNVTAGSEATSYTWVLPAAATVVDGTATAVEGQENTYTSTSASISVNLASVATETSFVFKVYGVNGNGTSLLSKDLTCTSAAPKAPTAIFSGGTGSGTAFAYNPSCGTVTISVPAVLGVVNDFISVSGGAILTNVSGNTATIDLSATSAVAKSTITIRAIASTATGSSSKDFVIKLGTPCGAGKMISEELVAEDFTVIAYPNPSASEFTIESSSKGATTVQVYDMMGRLIENAQANANSVQVGRNYAAGTYNVIVSQGAKAKTLKVIKK